MYCPTFPNEKCVHLSTKTISSFYRCKKCKACSHMMNTHLRIKSRQLCRLVVMVDVALHEKRVVKTKTKKNPFSEKFFHQSQSTTRELDSKKAKKISKYGIIVSTPHWLIQLTKNSFSFSFHTLSVYSKATWFSQSSTTVLSGLSTLDDIQLLWLWRISVEKWL